MARPPRPRSASLDLAPALRRPDPYKVLGVRPGVSDEELRAAYRRLVQLHHPDHNNGSPESARRFEEVQEAYAAITRERKRSATPPRWTPPPPPTDPDIERRLADLERELRAKAQAARERAQRAAREAASTATGRKRASDEELGYIKTDDTLGKILSDARQEISDRLGQVREEPVKDRVADLLDEVAAVLKGERSSGEEHKHE